MNENEKRFQFKQNACTSQGNETKCPVNEGLKFVARSDGKDEFEVRYVTYLNIVLAACPVCKSHKSVVEIK